MIQKNFPSQQVGQSAERADRDFLALEILEPFDLRRDDKAMQQELLGDVDRLALDIAGDNRVEGAGGVGKLKGVRDQAHGAQVASPGDDLDVHLLLREVTVLFGDEE